MVRSTTLFCAIVVLGVCLVAAAPARAANIISIDVPDFGDRYSCRVNSEGLHAPDGANMDIGPGWLIKAAQPAETDFVMHSHNMDVDPDPPVYQGQGWSVPDPAHAYILYTFDEPVIVGSIEFVEHAWGVTRVKAEVGDNLGALTELGNFYGAYGSNGNPFAERESYVFDFANTTVAGTYLKITLTETNNGEGYAIYRALLDGRYTDVPEPASLVVIALGGLALLRRRRA